MKTIGLIGGMSWESSAEYYRIINTSVRDRLGKLHSGKILLSSYDFEEIERLQHTEKWSELAQIMIATGLGLKNAGADALALCTNTMHLMADEVQTGTNTRLIHIADATAECIRSQGYKKVGLLGTKFTMEKDFYRKRIEKNYSIEVQIPDDESRNTVHRVIYDELCAGILNPESEKNYRAIIETLVRDGCEAIILGCTEIGLLVKQENFTIPLLDTTQIHANAIVDFILS